MQNVADAFDIAGRLSARRLRQVFTRGRHAEHVSISRAMKAPEPIGMKAEDVPEDTDFARSDPA
jgi:hypothetical protein